MIEQNVVTLVKEGPAWSSAAVHGRARDARVNPHWSVWLGVRPVVGTQHESSDRASLRGMGLPKPDTQNLQAAQDISPNTAKTTFTDTELPPGFNTTVTVMPRPQKGPDLGSPMRAELSVPDQP